MPTRTGTNREVLLRRRQTSQLSDEQTFLRYSDKAARYQIIFYVVYEIRNCKKTGLKASVEIQIFRRGYTLMASHFTGHAHQDNSN